MDSINSGLSKSPGDQGEEGRVECAGSPSRQAERGSGGNGRADRPLPVHIATSVKLVSRCWREKDDDHDFNVGKEGDSCHG